MTANTMRVGSVQLTRVGYADIGVPPDRVGLTPEQVAAVSWGEPTWVENGAVRAGAAAWVIQSGDARIVVDPAQAADDILRSDADAAMHQEAFSAVLDEAGVPRDSVTHVIATHLDGIGMIAWRNPDGSWVPFFPNAPILLHQRELDAIDAGAAKLQGMEVLAELRDQGAVQAVTGDHFQLTEEVSLEFTGAHTPGHQIVRISSGNETAVVLGHLAVSPLHLATGECHHMHPDPAGAQAALDALRKEDALLIGPLWPAPGAGRWVDNAFVTASG